MEAPSSTTASRYRALDILLRSEAPLVGGKLPYWRPRPAELERPAWVPAWSWRRHVLLPDEATDNMVVLDANAAYLSAITSVDVAHGPLFHTGSGVFDPRRPGYWLIDWFRWPATDVIMSPLGTATKGPVDSAGRVWLSTPTVQLLAQLADTGYWPELQVHDSWTATTRCRLRGWGDRIRRDRERAITMADEGLLAEIKLGYSQAVTLLGVDEKSRAYRPDWADTIRAQHAATIWRKAWRTAQLGYGYPAAAGSVDELVYPRSVIDHLLLDAEDGKAVPLRIDQEGLVLGTFKVKAVKAPQGLPRRGAKARKAAGK